MDFLTEPSRQIPVASQVDCCIIGGSCTGLFAAIRAARLGLKVAIVEQTNQLGGMATSAQVNHWHSTLDVWGKETIIAGLTAEVVERMERRGAIEHIPQPARVQYKFNSTTLVHLLDDMAQENGIELYLGSKFSSAIVKEGKIQAVVVEDVSGRRAIRATQFIDASGDGALLRSSGLPARKEDQLQPTSYQALITGWQKLMHTHPNLNLWSEVKHLCEKYEFPESVPWPSPMPGSSAVINLFGPRRHGRDASDPDQLTQAYLDGRRVMVAYIDMIKEHFKDLGGIDELGIASFAQSLGVRETWHSDSHFQLTQEDLLAGTFFPDSIAQGTYPVDVHHPNGCDLLYLDGRKEFSPTSGEKQWSRWRSEKIPTPACYHIPFRSLVPRGSKNLLVAGRLIDADRGAYGGVRVMVMCNQMGEAVGTAAALAMSSNMDLGQVDIEKLRNKLNQGGSCLKTPKNNL